MSETQVKELFELALSYRKNKEFSKAKKIYQQILEKNPKLQQAYFNLAFLHFNDNEPYKALKCYEKTLELLPNDIDTMYFLSLAYMQTKNYDKGLYYFESRLCRAASVATQLKTYAQKATLENIWDGKDISDKTIYIYYEAGFGDVIMFSRYLKLLEKKCKQIIFKPQCELAELFEDNFKNIKVLKYFEDIDFDIHLPLLSLPYVLNLKDDVIFLDHGGYLKANSQKIDLLKKDFFNNDKFKIGIKWQGNTFYDQERVLKIEDFYNLMDITNTQFYSCQTYEGSEEYNKIPKSYNVTNLADTFKDFSDTAAAVENLDLIICNDTSLAHIAGALNKPCWVLLPHVYNWRWHIDLNKCDWYDSIKLFRQENQGDWSDVFKKLQQELKIFVS